MASRASLIPVYAGIVNSVSQAWRIGRAIAICRKRNALSEIPKAILTVQNGACLFVGKIIGVDRVRVPIIMTWTKMLIIHIM